MSQISGRKILKNLYEIMGVPKNASDDDIKKAYRNLARKYHPDLNPNDQEAADKFKEAAAAFEVLGNPQTRSEYDAFGSVGGGNRPFGRNAPFTSAFEDMFNQVFGEQQRAIQKGQNIVVELPVTFQQIFTGADLEVKFFRRSVCEKCNGAGGKHTQCNHCNGTGAKIIHGRAMTVKASCHACNGSGKIVGEACDSCEGGYTQPKENIIQFKVYKGVENGMRFIQKGLGEPSLHPEGTSGDLLIALKVENSDVFERQPSGDLVVVWPVGYGELVAGVELQVPTIEGYVKLKIPPGTQPGTRLRLKQMGLPIFNPSSTIYQRGDQYVLIKLQMPEDIDDKYNKIIKKLAVCEEKYLSNIRKEINKKLGENHGRNQEK